MVALVGANGSGKTTILRLVAGLSRPSDGDVRVHGHHAGSREARRVTAFVPDEPGGLDELTVGEYVSLLGVLADAPQAIGRRAAEDLGLRDRLEVRVGTLSRGLRRRVALAGAFASCPSVVLLDEATATLDEETIGVLVELLRAHVDSGGCALLATHDLRFVDRACDRLVLLRNGALAGSGPAALAETLVALAQRAGTRGSAPRHPSIHRVATASEHAVRVDGPSAH